MNVYRLEPDYDKRGNSPWDWLSYGGEFDDLDDLLKQAPLHRTWEVPVVSLERRKGSGDFFYLNTNGCYVVNKVAKIALGPFLGEAVEFLKLQCAGVDELFVIHSLQHVNLAPDADVDRVMGDNITNIRRYSFDEGAIKGRHFFMVQQPSDSSAGKAGYSCRDHLVSEEFKEFIHGQRLKGVSFKQVFPV